MHTASHPPHPLRRQIVDKWSARAGTSTEAGGDHWGHWGLAVMMASGQTTSEIDDCPSIWRAITLAMDSARPCGVSRRGGGPGGGVPCVVRHEHGHANKCSAPLARGQHLKVTFAYPARGASVCVEGFAAAAIKHATRIINGPPAARYPTPPLLQLQLHLSLCGRACFPCPPWPAVIDFESFFNWQHSSRPGLCMDNQTAGGVAEWEAERGRHASRVICI